MSKLSLLLAPLLFACSEYGLVQNDKMQAQLSEEEGADLENSSSSQHLEEDDCIDSESAFDIEEVSTLQDAFGLPLVQDGLSLSVDESYNQPGKTWMPVSVEALVMMPDWYFDFYDDSNALTLHVFDSPTPNGGTHYEKRIQIRKSDLNWQALTLPANADWSGSERNQIAAWLTFDLTDVIGDEGFENTDYFVGVEWDDLGFPNVGYSNFEMPCNKNWTDYGNGAWRQNEGQDCSWPMFKIEIARYTEGECDD